MFHATMNGSAITSFISSINAETQNHPVDNVKKEIEWRPVRGCSGLYASSNGQIKREDRIYKQRIYRGYHYAGNFLVHRLVALAFHENPENKPIVRHKDSNKSNNTPENLAWATAKENVHDSIQEKTHVSVRIKSGEIKAGGHKLSTHDVDQIIIMANVFSKTALSERFNVSRQTIHNIINSYGLNKLAETFSLEDLDFIRTAPLCDEELACFYGLSNHEVRAIKLTGRRA